MSEKTEKEVQAEQVTPVPADAKGAATPAAGNAPESAPAKPAENKTEQDAKVTAAIVRYRQENRDLKRKLAEVNAAKPTVAPAEPEKAPAAPEPPKQATTVPVQNSQEQAVDPAIEKAAFMEMAKDSDIHSIGGMVELIDTIDGDSRLSKLYNIDPLLAMREGKAILMDKLAIRKPDPAPIAATPNASVGGHDSIQSLIAKLETMSPASKEYGDILAKINDAVRG